MILKRLQFAEMIAVALMLVLLVTIAKNSDAGSKDVEVTFTRDVAPILFENRRVS